MQQIRIGTTVTVEVNGERVTGRVYRDDEGSLRIDRGGREVNVTRDAEGYFPAWVTVIRIGK